MSRNEQLVRQQKLLQILEQARFGKTEEDLRLALVEELGLGSLSQKTVHRDLQALQYAGYDIDSERADGVPRWQAGPGLRNLPRLPVSVTELLALSIGREMLLPLAGTPYWQGIEMLWRKVQQIVPESVWKHFERHRRGMLLRGVPARSYQRHRGMLSTLDRAIRQHRVVRLQYQGAAESKPSIREIEPYCIVLHEGHVYVLAGVADASAEEPLRKFKLERCRKAVALDRRFRPRPDLDPEAYFAHSLGIYRSGEAQEFRIRVSGVLAAWVVETPFHPRQIVTREENGDLILTIPSAYEGEMLPRILAMGEHAELLSPEASRHNLARIVACLAERYRSGSAAS
jgi:predicted DNA-binding transcriptional regulator YafY